MYIYAKRGIAVCPGGVGRYIGSVVVLFVFVRGRIFFFFLGIGSISGDIFFFFYFSFFS